MKFPLKTLLLNVKLSVKDPVIEFDSLHEAKVTPVIEDPSECEISVKDPVIEFDSLHEANDAPVIEDTTNVNFPLKTLLLNSIL